MMLMQGFTETDRWFDVAVKVAKEFMKSHIISSDSDRIGVIFYGTVSPRLRLAAPDAVQQDIQPIIVPGNMLC